jgi:predicted ATPase
MRELATLPAEQRQDINGVDPRVLMLTQSVSISVHQGLLEQADAETLEALRIADERQHPPTQAWALSLARWMAYRQGDMDESIRLSQQLLELAERMGFKTRFGTGRMLMGRAMLAAGRIDEGTALLKEGHAMWSALGARAGATELASIAADALVEAGRLDDAEVFVRAGEKALVETDERFFAAELARLRARLQQAAGDAAAAEQGLRQAVAIAQGQDARLFALRAATDLARLLQAEGRPDAARGLLQPALAALSEGHTQRDARRASALLEALAAAAPTPA